MHGAKNKKVKKYVSEYRSIASAFSLLYSLDEFMTIFKTNISDVGI